MLDLREAHLNWIELGRVCCVKDGHHIKFLVYWFNYLGMMNAKVIHEESDLLVAMLLHDQLDVLDERLSIEGFVNDHRLLYAFFVGDAHEKSESRFIQEIFRQLDVVVLVTVLIVTHRLPSEHGLIDVDDFAAFRFTLR